ncbi:MAG: hypothetical protein N2691_05460 [Patescibacteria group bacterium]|nr:hypothetical protein [Patescibacteria group bacterium]
MSRRQKKNIASMIFLCILALIGTFAAGVRYGNSVAGTNDRIQSARVPSPIQSPSTTPKPYPSITFSRIELPGCGISATLPNFLKTESIASSSARFSGNGEHLSITCVRNEFTILPDVVASATVSATILGRPVTASSGAFLSSQSGPVVLFAIPGPLPGQRIQVMASENLMPLLEVGLQVL